MSIERLGPIDPIQKYTKSEKVNKPVAKHEGDTISVSDEARMRGEIMRSVEQARLIPDIRQDRVDEVRKKLEDPSYIDDKVVEKVADQIMSALDII